MSSREPIIATPKITFAHQIVPKRQRWLYAPDGHGLIPLGTGSIFAGAGGEGKSTFALDVAARLTRGELPGDLRGQKHRVIIFGPEDDWPTVMVPRLLGAGAYLESVAQVQAEAVIDEITRERELKFPLDVGLLREAVDATEAKLVIIDPAPSLMDGDMNKVQDVRRSYEPLMALAQSADLSMVLINHFGKGAGNVGHKLSGSHAWRDLTRSYLAFATDDDTGERVVSQDKNNYGPDRGSWKFMLESVDVPVEGGSTSVARVNFLGASELTVGEIINRQPPGDEDDEDDRSAAQNFIVDYIKERESEEAPAKDVIKAGRATGFSENEIKNARKRCRNPRIKSAKASFGAGWVWQIDTDSDAESAEGVTKVSKVSHSQNTDPFDTLGRESDTLGELNHHDQNSEGVGASGPEHKDQVAVRYQHLQTAHQHRAEVGGEKLTAKALANRTGWDLQHAASILVQLQRQEVSASP